MNRRKNERLKNNRKPEHSPFLLNILMISLALPPTTLHGGSRLGVKPEDAGTGYLITGDGTMGGGILLNSLKWAYGAAPMYSQGESV
jgi:hypothetical protein